MISILKAAVLGVKDILWNPPALRDIDEEELEETIEQIREKYAEPDQNAVIDAALKYERCVKAYGKATLLRGGNGIIDDKHLFSNDIPKPNNLKNGDIVQFLSYKADNGLVKIVQILSVVDSFDTDNEQYKDEVVGYNVSKRVVVGKVLKRDGRDVILSEKNIRFSLDNVTINFVPIIGDWLQVTVQAQLDEEEPNLDSVGSILEVEEVRALRCQIISAKVTHWDQQSKVGTVNERVFFSISSCQTGYIPVVGDMVTVDAIESEQGSLTWRALSVVLISSNKVSSVTPQVKKTTSVVENKKWVIISDNLDFGTLKLNETKQLEVEVLNNSTFHQKLLKAIFHTKKSDSQLKLLQGYNNYELKPDSKITFIFECQPRFLGYSEEMFVFQFKDFVIKRKFKIYAVDPRWSEFKLENSNSISVIEQSRLNLDKLREQENRIFIPGTKLKKPPAFIAIRCPTFHIPTRMWNIIYDYYHKEKESISNEYLLKSLPVLSADTHLGNYSDKFHTLLYLEEIDHLMKLKTFDMDRGFLNHEGEFLVLQIEGLAERRPSVMLGDAVKVRNPVDSKSTLYEGVIHQMGANKLFLKFCRQFHSTYRGEDLNIQFSVSRTNFTRCHYGVDLAMKHLGKEVLFPTHLKVKPPQVNIIDANDPPVNNNEGGEPDLKTRHIKWFNENLNDIQKVAVKNVLMGVARPLPYVIFGPPGTGKTVTLVETVLQLYCLLPDSRILVATPSNSSADLFSERLVDCASITPGSLVRVVANYIAVRGGVSEKLKPYCATVDLSMDNDNQYSGAYRVRNDGMRLNCRKSNIGHHRITIGTCSTIGALFRLGLPRGHFSHIVVDEAGQATEPEVMIPLAFIDKFEGQAILAGDPMQLGPVVVSHLASDNGLGDSFLERLLRSFPYQKDMECFKNCAGYDPRLVTKLMYNYRSIPKLLTLPSEMFYNSALIPQVSMEMDWVQKIIKLTSPVLDLSPSDEFPGLVFMGIRGINMRAADSPSWYNPHEASMVLMFVCKLLTQGVDIKDIGIITPYLQQIRFIRSLFVDMGKECPKVGTVEEFQGQERKIIVMSTVRSTESFLPSDIKHFLGFVKNPKRLNVGITRAQVLLVIFGNPCLLALDPLWRRIIQYAIKNGKYKGCDLPPELTRDGEF